MCELTSACACVEANTVSRVLREGMFFVSCVYVKQVQLFSEMASCIFL